jgi:soluble lytic murein transglycosylase-like protein
MVRRSLCWLLIWGMSPVLAEEARPNPDLAALIVHEARANNVPEALVQRVIKRESGYNALLRNGPNWGLMQIRHDTARSLGYDGPPKGLLDARTNLTYGVVYLANAYRVAGGDVQRAIALYTHGYYYEAKRKGMLGLLRTAERKP